MKLTNTRRPLKGKHNRNDNETKKRVRIGYCFAKVLFFLWTKIYQHHGSAYLPFVGREEQWQMRVLPFLKTVREKGIQRRVKWWLLRPCFCDLTPHCFVICDRRDRGVDSVLYTVLHASKHGRKRRDVAFFYSFNQSIRELRFHLFGFGNTVHNGSHDAKSYFHIWLHIVDALNRTTWFCSCVLSIQISIILI